MAVKRSFDDAALKFLILPAKDYKLLVDWEERQSNADTQEFQSSAAAVQQKEAKREKAKGTGRDRRNQKCNWLEKQSSRLEETKEKFHGGTDSGKRTRNLSIISPIRILNRVKSHSTGAYGSCRGVPPGGLKNMAVLFQTMLPKRRELYGGNNKRKTKVVFIGEVRGRIRQIQDSLNSAA